MRAIFLTLVVANLVAFGVLWLRGDPAVPAAAGAGHHPAPAAERLLLLGERLGEGPEVALPEPLERHQFEQHQFEQQQVVNGQAPGDRGQAVCTLVGPFKQHLPAEYFVEHLQALDVLAEVVLLEVPGKPNYWVHQNPESSRKAALRRLHELQAKGVDSYVIPKGDLENGISFGLFSERKRADGLAAEIRARGYAAEVREVPRSFEEIWVSMAAGEADKIGREPWLELLNRESGLEKRENFCPAVASR